MRMARRRAVRPRASRRRLDAPYLASGAGSHALRRGGSAVDAAIAANAVLCVVYPHMAGLGGDGFWLIGEATGRVHGINASGPTTRLATRDYYRPRSKNGEIPPRGPLSALTVPGAIDGWRIAHERFGRLDWREFFEDSIVYARDGAPASRSLVQWTAKATDVLMERPATAAIFLPGGRVPLVGQRLVEADLARSLVEIAAKGSRAAFYEGGVAERICADLQAEGSPLRADDFGEFHAEWVEPIASLWPARQARRGARQAHVNARAFVS